jgi:hypothetical protein
VRLQQENFPRMTYSQISAHVARCFAMRRHAYIFTNFSHTFFPIKVLVACLTQTIFPYSRAYSFSDAHQMLQFDARFCIIYDIISLAFLLFDLIFTILQLLSLSRLSHSPSYCINFARQNERNKNRE